jgi:hypothetical protein
VGDRLGKLLAEVDSNGQIQRQYVYLADILLAVIDTQSKKEGKNLSLLSNHERFAHITQAQPPQNPLKTALRPCLKALLRHDMVSTQAG